MKLVLCSLMVFSVLQAFAPLAFAGANDFGIVTSVIGKVEILSSQSQLATLARMGQKVFPGDAVMTEVGSRARIRMNASNILDVSPNSKVRIQTYQTGETTQPKRVALMIDFGQVRSQVNQKYEASGSTYRVVTPSAVAGVRGTDFLVNYDKVLGSSEIVAFKGEVEVGASTNAQDQIVTASRLKAGEAISVRRGEAPSKIEVLPKEKLDRLRAASESPGSKEADAKPLPHQETGEKSPDKSAEKLTDKSPEKLADKLEEKKEASHKAK